MNPPAAVGRGRAGILKGRRQEKPAGTSRYSTSHADSSSISSLHSISTQASVYAPTFNPAASKPIPDVYYDSINDSDTSTLGPNGGIRLTSAIRARPPNLTPVHAEPLANLDPPLLPPSRRFPSTDDLTSAQGYFSDASSMSSSARLGLKPHFDSRTPTSSDTPRPPKSPAVIPNLSFKERNFNFDFENESLTSTMGVQQAFEDLYGIPARPPQPPPETSLSSSHTPAPTSTTSISQSNPSINEGFDASQRLPPKKTSTNGVVHPKALDTIHDANTPASSNAASTARHSSISSSSLLNKSSLDVNKRMDVSAQTPLENSTEFSSEGTSSEFGEGQGNSLEKTLAKGTFLLCIPKGICMPDGNAKSMAPRSPFDDNTTHPVNPIKSLWADAYQPTSFDELLCHVQQAEFLRQLISQGNCPHLFFHGNSTYGKKLLIKVLVREIYGPLAWKVSQEKREFKKKGEKKVMKELLASKFHVELDGEDLGENARAILTGLCKEITQTLESSRVITPGESYETSFRVIVLYQVEKLSNDTQQLLRWIMDRYEDTCKFLLCSYQDSNVLESVKARCQNLCVDPPSQQEIVSFLQHIARKENLRVSLDFMMRIAYESKQNLRHAIESLEALKPPRQGQAFKEELPIPTGWEDTVVEVANEILSDQTPKRMYIARQKLQTLLQKHVSPRVILQSMVLELLNKVDNQLIQEVCYWHGIYDKRLYASNLSIDKLEEFVARIMSIFKKYKKTNHV